MHLLALGFEVHHTGLKMNKNNSNYPATNILITDRLVRAVLNLTATETKTRNMIEYFDGTADKEIKSATDEYNNALEATLEKMQ